MLWATDVHVLSCLDLACFVLIWLVLSDIAGDDYPKCIDACRRVYYSFYWVGFLKECIDACMHAHVRGHMMAVRLDSP